MKKYIYISILFFIAVSFSVAQKPFEPATCYKLKSSMSSFSNASTNDTRGDLIDILNYSIDLDITDFTAKELSGNTQIRFKAKEVNINSIELDLLILDIDSITFMDNLITTFTYNDTLIHIDFPTNLTVNNDYRIKVFYHGAPIQISGDWGGFFWNNTYAYNVGVSFTEDIHNFGKAWFPCFDNFTVRSTYDFRITTQANHKAFCNGLLTNEITNTNGTKTWVWKLNQKIPTYLASVAVANYATVYDSYSGLVTVPIQLAARHQDTTNLKASFVHLKDAMSSFEDRFGKYRFDRVGFCVTSFAAGAMEHATNITYMNAVVNGNTQYETLMAHELSHHWWGNNTTCETAEDMWLNEGFASYAEAIFTESVYGKEAYKNYSRKNHDDVLRRTHIRDGAYYAVSGIPSNQTYSSTVYDKGSDMIHTLRGILGDQIFFDALKSFQEAWKFSHINTDMFKDYLSNFSNLNLTSFFNTWIKEPGFNHYSLSGVEVLNSENGYTVQGSIKQKLWVKNSFTDFLPLEITFFDANWDKTTETVFVYGGCSNFQVELDFEPIFWALDLEEKIQDATVDKYLTISNTGLTNFGLARLEIDVQTISDSALVRVVHHYIKPDAMENKIANLHLSPNRYWSVSGIFPTDFKSNAIFRYDGTVNNTTGYLDNDFITNSEDSLVILYRQDESEDWALVDSFFVNVISNPNNKKGSINVFNLKKGDYVLGIYDSNISQDTENKTTCVFTSINNIERLEKLIKIYPVPAKDFVNIEFLATNKNIKELKVHNILGKKIDSFDINIEESVKTISTKKWHKGIYILNFIDNNNNNVYSKKITVE